MRGVYVSVCASALVGVCAYMCALVGVCAYRCACVYLLARLDFTLPLREDVSLCHEKGLFASFKIPLLPCYRLLGNNSVT